jgi:hypothetical protein
MKKKKTDNDRDNYLRDLAEWNEHQYSPGHWTGGKIPPQAKYGGRLLGKGIMVLGIFAMLSVVAEIYFKKDSTLTQFLWVGLVL